MINGALLLGRADTSEETLKYLMEDKSKIVEMRCQTKIKAVIYFIGEFDQPVGNETIKTNINVFSHTIEKQRNKA